jgi:hypothetical protein
MDKWGKAPGDLADGRTREIAVGHSRASDPVAAAHEACDMALAGRTPVEGDLMILFPTVEYDPALFFGTARKIVAPAHVIGCSSFTSFTNTTLVRRGTVSAFLPAGNLSFGVAGVDNVGRDIYRAAREVTQLALERAGGEGEHAALMVLSDGLAGDQREVVRGCYEVAGATVPLVGGAAGENQQAFTTYQCADDQVMSNGLVAVWINGATPLGVAVDHGWHPIGDPMIVTRAKRNIVHELDGLPAVQAYLAQREADPMDRNLYGEGDVTFSASTADEPLGLANISGRFDIRHILRRTREDGLELFGHVNEQSVVQVMTGDWQDLVQAAERAGAEASAQLVSEPRGALVFSCTGRVAPLGQHLGDEATAVARSIGDQPMAGFFTYGEFARVTGSTGFHNATVVVLAL